MTIAFNQIPSNLRIPWVGVEFDASQASQGPAILAFRGLLIGQKTSAGSAAANSLHRVTRADSVIALAGQGSLLHRLAIAWFAENQETETWIGVLSDDNSGVQASGTITVSGPATAAGTIALYLGGERVTVGVASGDANTAIATAIGAAINASGSLAVTATVSNAVVTVTYRHKGAVGNSYDVRHSYRIGEQLPSGVGLTIVAMASGATNPSLASLIAAMGDTWFHVIAHPYTDATSLSAIEAELASRAGPMRMIDGLAITSASGTHSALTTLGGARNSAWSIIASQPGESPVTPPAEFAAGCAAVIARAAAADPARPFQTLSVTRALPPAEADLFTSSERNLLLFDGIATSVALPGGAVQVERAITTYQNAPSGDDDTSYLDSNTPLTLMLLRYTWRVRMRKKYPRHKLGNDDARFGPGQLVMTPKLARAEAIAWYQEQMDRGLVENLPAFKAALVVERSQTNPNRLDLLLPPDLINQLMVVATNMQFRV
jgi:phage tail sheath gpL-like